MSTQLIALLANLSTSNYCLMTCLSVLFIFSGNYFRVVLSNLPPTAYFYFSSIVLHSLVFLLHTFSQSHSVSSGLFLYCLNRAHFDFSLSLLFCLLIFIIYWRINSLLSCDSCKKILNLVEPFFWGSYSRVFLLPRRSIPFP